MVGKAIGIGAVLVGFGWLALKAAAMLAPLAEALGR